MTQIASLRLLDAHEIAAVSGGDDDEIVVVAPRRVTNSYDLDPFYTLNANIISALGSNWLDSGAGGGGGGGGSAPAPSDPEDGDMDGDGIPDSVDTEDNRTIVVTGHDLDDAFQVRGNIYAVWDTPGLIATWYYWVPYDIFGFSGDWVRLGQYQVGSITIPNEPEVSVTLPPVITFPPPETTWIPLPRDGNHRR